MELVFVRCVICIMELWWFCASSQVDGAYIELNDVPLVTSMRRTRQQKTHGLFHFRGHFFLQCAPKISVRKIFRQWYGSLLGVVHLRQWCLWLSSLLQNLVSPLGWPGTDALPSLPHNQVASFRTGMTSKIPTLGVARTIQNTKIKMIGKIF